MRQPDNSQMDKVLSKYEIPNELRDKLFSTKAGSGYFSETPADIAVELASKDAALNFEDEYLKKLILRIRKQFNRNWTIIDVDYSEYGRRIYAVTSWNNAHINELRYTSIKKGKFFKQETFLVETRN